MKKKISKKTEKVKDNNNNNNKQITPQSEKKFERFEFIDISNEIIQKKTKNQIVKKYKLIEHVYGKTFPVIIIFEIIKEKSGYSLYFYDDLSSLYLHPEQTKWVINNIKKL